MPGSPPPVTLLTGPSGSGKTAECLRRFREAGDRALLLVPSPGHRRRLEDRLSEGSPGVPVGAISTLRELAESMARPPSGTRVISRSLQRMIVADTFERVVGPDGYFGRMRGAPGFPDVLLGCIREMRLARLAAADLHEAVESAAAHVDDPGFARKLSELASILGAYEGFLREHHLWDEEDLPLHIAEHQEIPVPGSPSVVLVEGFLRLAPVWRAMLASLAARGIELTVTLLCEPTRPLLFASSLRAMGELRASFTVNDVALPVPEEGGRPKPLRALERGLFGGADGLREAVADGEAPALLLMDAPNAYAEAEMVARELRREHDRRGVRWSECAIVVRTIDQYEAVLTSVCGRYDIPLAPRRDRPVAEAPMAAAVADLLSLFAGGWTRDTVLAFLKSPCVSVDRVAVDRLRRRAYRWGLQAGRPGWERAAASLQEKRDPLGATLERMTRWDAKLHEKPLPAARFAALVDEIVADLGLQTVGGADAEAWEAARRILSEVGQAARMSDREAVDADEYAREVSAAWRAATFSIQPRADAVQVLEAHAARQVRPRSAAVMGMVERVFPRRVTEDPFLRDDEPEALCQVAGISLERRQDRSDDERLLFYMAASAPTERLILSWPRSDERSDALRSFYIDEVEELFAHVPARVSTLADVAPRPEECVSDRDRLLAACAGGPPEEYDPPAVESVRASAERPRLPRLDGEELRKAYGGRRRYGVTELEEYNTCPFRHLMRRGLRVYAERPGATAADRGTLLHRVLSRCLRRRATDAAPPSAEQMQADLLAELRVCMAEAILDAPPHRRKMLERFLADALAAFVERELRCREQFGFTPAWFELAFGMQNGQADDEDEVSGGDRDYDADSRADPLEVSGVDGHPSVQVCGAMDRVDLAGDGRRALVLDYKAGKSVEFPFIKEGRSLQMVCYLLALERLWGKVAAVGCYDSPRDNGRRRFFRVEHVENKRLQPAPGEDGRVVKPVGSAEFAQTVQAVEEAVRRAADGIASCSVPATPGEHCATCDYLDVCRMSLDGSHDGETVMRV